MPRPSVSNEDLELDVQAYYEAGGNKAQAARARNLRRQTYNSRLTTAERRLGITLGKIVDGRVDIAEIVKKRLPRKGHIKRYVLTSAQNNTHPHPGFNNLLAYVHFLDGLADASCELLVGTYSYQTTTYGPKAVKRGKYKPTMNDKLWYAPELEDYIVDESVELAPGLVWCGEQNILPTTKHPLTDFETYNGRKSNIVPHARIQMESVASMADEATKLNYSTGTVTQLNYIQKRAGILAEQRHDYGAMLIEVDHNGNWWPRQLYIDEDDAVMDVGPDGFCGIYVQAGTVYEDEVSESIYWGDAHATEQELWVRDLAWGKGGMLDTLKARYQFMGDAYSMCTRGHHEMDDFHQMYRKHVDGQETVEDEVQLTADFLAGAEREWCETVMVPDNHGAHLDRWLNEADFRTDPVNAKFFCLLQYQVLDAMDRGEKDFSILEWVLTRAGAPDTIRYLSQDESFIVAGVENALHGHQGPNGSRGSTRSLTKLGRPLNKGHDHTAAIRDQVFSSGACSSSFSYASGPSSHSVSHIVTYRNGKRAIVTMWANRWRA